MALLCSAHHIVKYCPKWQLDDNHRPTTAAFYLRNCCEKGLSVNWVEYFGAPTKADALEQIKCVIQLNRKRSGRFVLINVGEAQRAALQVGRKIAVERDPTCKDKSHCLITGYPEPKDDSLALALREQVRKVLPAL